MAVQGVLYKATYLWKVHPRGSAAIRSSAPKSTAPTATTNSISTDSRAKRRFRYPRREKNLFLGSKVRPSCVCPVNLGSAADDAGEGRPDGVIEVRFGVKAGADQRFMSGPFSRREQ